MQSNQDLNPKAWAGRIYRKYTTSGGVVLARYLIAILAPDGNPARIYAHNGALLSSTGEAETDSQGLLDVYVLADHQYKILVLHPSSRARVIVEEGVWSRVNADVEVPELDSNETRQVRALLSQSPVAPTYPAATNFTYTLGKLTRIDYADNSFKVLSYNVESQLAYIDFTQGETTTRKTFVRNVDNVLVQIVESVV